MNKKYLLTGSAIFLLIIYWQCKSPSINNWEIANPATPITQIIFFGDSLTSGFGLKDNKTSFPHQLSKELNLPFKIYGYPGNTTADGLKKIKNLKDEPPSLVILTLGGNDILRRRKLAETKMNLDQLFSKLQNWGHTIIYTEVLSIMDGKRHLMHIELCKKYKIAIVPDILSGMLSGTEHMQGDSIHPNVSGCQLISQRILKVLKASKFID